MLTLSKHITLDETALKSPNLTPRFEDRDLEAIGSYVLDAYKTDYMSCSSWRTRNEAAMDLAMQVVEEKSFPWQGASNVKIPLITIAALQFHARAYPALIQGDNVVKYNWIGSDPQGLEGQRAQRIGDFMSWQVLEQDEGWEEQYDRSLLVSPIVGCSFTKSYYNSMRGYPVDDFVFAKDLVMDYYAKTLEDCDRKTHRVPLSHNEIYERVHRKTFRNCLEEKWYLDEAPQPMMTTEQDAADNRRGITPPASLDASVPFFALEQHVNLDLDGDGYAEPYMVTIEETSGYVFRIVTRFGRAEDVDRLAPKKSETLGRIVKVTPREYFTKHGFIPSPDGGIYDIGFGTLLGPLSHSADSIINQLIDAGTLRTAAGGFLARGAKIRGGVYNFSQFGWNRVDATGDDLRKSIVPLPTNEPSGVLLELLTFLVDYVNRTASTTETNTGENPGQNTPKYNMQVMSANGQRVYSAIYKRRWRSLKLMFKKRYLINRRNPPMKANAPEGMGISGQDFLAEENNVRPCANRNVISEEREMEQIMAVKQSSMMTPGYDRLEVERRWLRVLRIDAPEKIFPGPDKVPPLPNPKMEVEKLKLQSKQAELQSKQQQFTMTLQSEQAKNQAEIIKLHAEAAALLADIDANKEGQEIAKLELQLGHINAQLEAKKQHNEHVKGMIETMQKGIELDQQQQQIDQGGDRSMADSSSDAGA